MTHHWIRTGLDRLRRTGAALTAAACALGLPGFLTRQTPASAANLVLVYAESVEAQPGDTAQVSLYAEDNGGFSGMGLVLEYDGALELVTDEDGKPRCTYGDLIGSDTCMILEAEGSKCGVAIASSQLIQQDGTLVTLSFRVPQTAQPGDTFALNLTANAAYDNGDNAVSIQTYSGKIQISQATTTEPTTTTETTTTTTTTTTETTTTTTTTTAPAPVEFSIGHASGLPGETVYLPVCVGPHSGISNMEFLLQLPEIFQPALSNDEYQLVGIPPLWSMGTAHNTTGGLAVALGTGSNPDVTGELFRIQLVIPEDATPGEYEISVQSVAIRNPEGTAYTCVTAPGSVQVRMPETTRAESTTTTTETTTTTTTTTETTTTTTTTITTTLAPVEFSVGHASGLPGETVYLPVYVGENPGLSAAVLTFRYGGMLQPADTNSTPQVQYLKAGYWGEVSYDTQLLTVSMHAAWSQYENGEILRIPVVIPADAVPGIYPVTPESASFAAMDGSTRQCSLFAGTVQVMEAVTTSAQVTENTTTTATEAVTTTETTTETTITTTTETTTETTTTTAAETTITTTTTAAETTTETTITTTTETTTETTTTTAAETTTVPIQTTTALQPGYPPGDVNMDGRVTVADAVLVLEACARMAAGEPCPLSDVQQKLGDLVPDGDIKVSDAVELLGIIARGIAG